MIIPSARGTAAIPCHPHPALPKDQLPANPVIAPSGVEMAGFSPLG
jgi:hypothetical protein